MNESGATAFEVRNMAREIENEDRGMFLGRELYIEGSYKSDPLTHQERAILVEALTLLAKKKGNYIDESL
jgi:hypothetical protein